MKRNKLLISFARSFLVVLVLGFAGKANAQWALPDGAIFNLPSDMGAGILSLTNWFLWLTGLLSVLMIIWGGINYIFSSGDTQKSELAKRIIYYAMIGLFVAGFAYALVQVITNVILKN